MTSRLGSDSRKLGILLPRHAERILGPKIPVPKGWVGVETGRNIKLPTQRNECRVLNLEAPNLQLILAVFKETKLYLYLLKLKTCINGGLIQPLLYFLSVSILIFNCGRVMAYTCQCRTNEAQWRLLICKVDTSLYKQTQHMHKYTTGMQVLTGHLTQMTYLFVSTVWTGGLPCDARKNGAQLDVIILVVGWLSH